MSGAEKFTILVVDDERSNIIALNHILKPMYSTLVAINGQTAIEIAKENLPDLILLDVIMPDMTGFEVLAELKAFEATQGIPVIFITGLDSTEDEEMGFFLGAVDYITKPFHNSIVKARVKTHLKMAEYVRMIERQCMIDVLTDIPNRRSFISYLNSEWGRAIREKTSISVLMIDVDRFKEYNDAYGHPQGDALLQSVTKIFSQSLKRHADYLARWGGDEFTVLLPNTDIDGTFEVAEQIRLGVERAVISVDDKTDAVITVSIGANAHKPVAGDSPDDFISDADKALYHAKETGRNRVCAYDGERQDAQ